MNTCKRHRLRPDIIAHAVWRSWPVDTGLRHDYLQRP